MICMIYFWDTLKYCNVMFKCFSMEECLCSRSEIDLCYHMYPVWRDGTSSMAIFKCLFSPSIVQYLG